MARSSGWAWPDSRRPRKPRRRRVASRRRSRSSCAPAEVLDAFRVRGAVLDEAAVVQAVGEALEAGLGYCRGARPEARAVIALEGRAQHVLRYVGKEGRSHACELGRSVLGDPAED